MPDFIIICHATIESVSYRKQHEYSVDELRVPAFIDLTKTHCEEFLAHYRKINGGRGLSFCDFCSQ